MRPKLFLRIAAVITFFQSVGHTVGFVFGKSGQGPATAAVEAMKMNQFLLMGHSRSYWDFYHGLGLGATISLRAEAILFWQLASLAERDASRLRPIGEAEQRGAHPPARRGGAHLPGRGRPDYVVRLCAEAGDAQDWIRYMQRNHCGSIL
jgi:hypothetical protein